MIARELQEAPVASRRDGTKERGQRIFLAFVKNPSGDQLGGALGKTGIDPLVLRFDNREDGSVNGVRIAVAREQVVAVAAQPALHIDIEVHSQKQADLRPALTAHFRQNRHDNERFVLGNGLLHKLARGGRILSLEEPRLEVHAQPERALKHREVGEVRVRHRE